MIVFEEKNIIIYSIYIKPYNKIKLVIKKDSYIYLMIHNQCICTHKPKPITLFQGLKHINFTLTPRSSITIFNVFSHGKLHSPVQTILKFVMSSKLHYIPKFMASGC